MKGVREKHIPKEPAPSTLKETAGIRTWERRRRDWSDVGVFLEKWGGKKSRGNQGAETLREPGRYYAPEGGNGKPGKGWRKKGDTLGQ